MILLPKLLKLNRIEGKKGFTLIELLVVIAVLGILASVVLVAINPSERIAEANDAGVKNDISQVATAVESYYTNNNGDYTGVAIADLVSQGYIKRDPGGVTLSENGTAALAYGALSASTQSCDSGSGALKFWVYRAETGVSQCECMASGTPSL